MSKQEQLERAIASGYGSAYFDLVRLGVILLDSDQDPLSMKETVHRLSEVEAKEMLTVAAACAAHDFAFRDGRVARFSSHLDRNRALEPAGYGE
jgi:hypothetical protein